MTGQQSTGLLRGVFIVLLVLTVGWKLAASPAPRQADDISRDLDAVLGARLAGPVTGSPWSNTISVYLAPVSGCANPLIIATAPSTFSAASVLPRMERPGDHHLFVYRDWAAAQPDRWTVLRRQLWDKARAMTGAGPHPNSDKLLFIAESEGCAVAREVPWSRFWAPRQFISQVSPSPSPASKAP